MSRPYFNFSIDELEAAFDRGRDDAPFLDTLLEELSHRNTDRAARLRGRALQALGTLSKGPGIPAEPPARGQTGAALPPPITDRPEGILDAWAALEVLSPPTFRRPEDLAGTREAVAPLENGRLPWEGGGERAKPNKKLYYQVVLGSIDMEKAVAGMLRRFADQRVERPSVKGEAVLAAVILDREGRPVQSPACAVASFGWGVPKALNGDLAGLSAWPVAEAGLVAGLDSRLRRAGDDGKDLPLDRDRMGAAFAWLVEALALPGDLVRPPRFAIRNQEYFKSENPPEPLLLNSFFLGDLAAARQAFVEGKAPPLLRRYLGVDVPAARHDLLHDRTALERAVCPDLVPPGRWPGKGRHPLVLLQQAAVNLTRDELRQGGILAVNGPPGTGKTTLLRDLVAALVTARAEAMASFDDPESAFSPSGRKIKAGTAWLHLYHLDGRLKDFEMLVASSNNKAVENVSGEVPVLDAVAEDAGLRYFATVSDRLLKRPTWGLAAAVLGNARNRFDFTQGFWWDQDLGMAAYLSAATGKVGAVPDNEAGPKAIPAKTRPPKVVSFEDAPRDHTEALKRWQAARCRFREALDRSRRRLCDLARLREILLHLPGLMEAVAAAGGVVAEVQEEAVRLAGAQGAALARLEAADTAWKEALGHLGLHDHLRPGFWARLFRSREARDWRAARLPLVATVQQWAEEKARTSAELKRHEELWGNVTVRRTAADQSLASARKILAQAEAEIAQGRTDLGDHLPDEDFWCRDHGRKHKSVPWLDPATQGLRDEVFVAAMGLHKAFIDAAAKPLRHNLGALVNVLGGRPLASPEKAALLPELWASLFLVVPLVSTTFASVERMLGRLPRESLGWLLVDEAGQALPQAAVGALMRARRAVVVGDPLQIEPVVVLPDSLTQAICRHFGADPDRFNGPEASVQTLADAATPYLAEFAGRMGSRTVGVPLLVHRRCADPMFGIANAVAYDHLMVQARGDAKSPVLEILGPSSWFHVAGTAEEKWCPEEGAVVIDLLRRLVAANLADDLYVVTPFVVVADRLRDLVQRSGLRPWDWCRDRIGTVHTVQGREATAVILVLGAPSPEQSGARAWAGGRPNLLNVAVTRAKEALYVVGNRELWRGAGVFQVLDRGLPE